MALYKSVYYYYYYYYADYILNSLLQLDVNVNFGDLYALSTTANTRGHKYKLSKPIGAQLALDKSFFVDSKFSIFKCFRNSIEKIDFFLVFLFMVFYLCGRICTQKLFYYTFHGSC